MKTGLIVAALALGASNAYSQELPSAIDLKAAYCVGVENSTLKLVGDMNTVIDSLPSSMPERTRMKKENADRQFEIGRPRRYLKPRMPYLDLTGIILAIQSGESDVERMGAASGACVESCGGNSKSPVSEPAVANCSSDCMYSTAPGKRVWSCQDLSWLPY